MSFTDARLSPEPAGAERRADSRADSRAFVRTYRETPQKPWCDALELRAFCYDDAPAAKRARTAASSMDLLRKHAEMLQKAQENHMVQMQEWRDKMRAYDEERAREAAALRERAEEVAAHILRELCNFMLVHNRSEYEIKVELSREGTIGEPLSPAIATAHRTYDSKLQKMLCEMMDADECAVLAQVLEEAKLRVEKKKKWCNAHGIGVVLVVGTYAGMATDEDELLAGKDVLTALASED